MSDKIANQKIFEFVNWYNNYNFKAITEKNKRKIIIDKLNELRIFWKYNTKQIGYFVDTYLDEILIDANAVRILEIIRDVLKNDEPLEGLQAKALEMLLEIMEIGENQEQQVENLANEIKVLVSEKSEEEKKNLSFLASDEMAQIIRYVSKDKQCDFILELLQSCSKKDNCSTFEHWSMEIKSFDDKLALFKAAVDYGKTVGKKFVDALALIDAMYVTMEATTEEDVEFLISKLKEIIEDKRFKSYVNSDSLSALFSAIKGDELKIYAYERIRDDSFFVRAKINKQTISEIFLNSINDGKKGFDIGCELLKDNLIEESYFKRYFEKYDAKTKLILLTDAYNKGALSMDIINQWIYKIDDTSLFFNKDLMENFYKDERFKPSIYRLLGGRHDEEHIKLEEIKLIQEGRLDELLEKYATVGLIDEETLDNVYQIASKYNRNLTRSDMLKQIATHPNVQKIILHIANSSKTKISRWDTEKTEYEYALERFKNIFGKVRFGDMPATAVYYNIPTELLKNFDVKTYRALDNNPLFNKDEYSKKTLFKIIAFCGLFENDDQVEVRRKEVISLLENYTAPILREELESLSTYNLTIDDEWINSRFNATTIKTYHLRAGVVVPEDLKSWLSNDLSEEQMRRIKQLNGNIGAELAKYLSPYARSKNGWKLRNGIAIGQYLPYLKEEMTNEEYRNLLTSNDTPDAIINFLNPYIEVRKPACVIKNNLKPEIKDGVIQLLLKSTLNHRYNFDNLHRMFDGGLRESFSPEFYKFFMENQDQILASPENQAQFIKINRKFKEIKEYYASRGNSNPNYNDMVMYLVKAEYPNISFGNKEFAQDAKNTQVSPDAYTFYQNLLEVTRKRHLTTLPRHHKTYEYVDENTGKTYQVMAKVLRSDDPFNLLVGETNFSNCCQRYRREGHDCMVHASTSQDGGIFATYLIIDGVPHMLTQSWFWTNEAKACLDNVEATRLITNPTVGSRKLMQDMATFAIRESCKEMMKTSKVKVDEYVEKMANKINNSSLSEREKSEKLAELEMVRKRQTLKVITVGSGYDDLNVRESFPQIESIKNSYGPKGFVGYRDSTGMLGKEQHIIIKADDEEILPIDDKYQAVPIYRDDRRVNFESGAKIRQETLKKIADIEASAHKKEMLEYTKDGKYQIMDPKSLAESHGCSLEKLRVLSGEDWYYVYSNAEHEIEVLDLAKTSPRMEDEGKEQIDEIYSAFKKILSEAIVLGEDNKVLKVKPIKAQLREDTSYLLYLTQIKHGVIEQIGDEVTYSYMNQDNKTNNGKVSKKDIREIFKRIRKGKNDDMMMHEVVFKPTDKMIEQLVQKLIEEKQRTGRKK